MLDWILSQNCRNTLPLHAVDKLVRKAKNESLFHLSKPGIKHILEDQYQTVEAWVCFQGLLPKILGSLSQFMTWEMVEMIFWLVWGFCNLEGGITFHYGSGWCGCGGLWGRGYWMVDFGIMVVEWDSPFRGAFVWSWVVWRNGLLIEWLVGWM